MKILKQMILTVTILLAALAVAEDEVRGKSIKLKTAKTASLDNSYHLRCWQDGELLFEETDLNPKASKLNLSVASFVKEGEKKPNIYLMETGSSTCLYKKM
jgi:hypothetical protein